jgi:bacteriocin-like protein
MTALDNKLCELSIDELNGVSGGDVRKPPVKPELGGSSFGGGSITKGGLNCNVAAGAFSSAD